VITGSVRLPLSQQSDAAVVSEEEARLLAEALAMKQRQAEVRPSDRCRLSSAASRLPGQVHLPGNRTTFLARHHLAGLRRRLAWLLLPLRQVASLSCGRDAISRRSPGTQVRRDEAEAEARRIFQAMPPRPLRAGAVANMIAARRLK
jgi:hypothetical protein